MKKDLDSPSVAAKKAERARNALFRYMEQQRRVADVMLQVGRAVGPAIHDPSSLGPGYLAGETSLITEDFGFFASPVMAWWKTVLWAHDPRWIFKPPNKRVSARWSILPQGLIDFSQVRRDAIRAAIHLMLLDSFYILYQRRISVPRTFSASRSEWHHTMLLQNRQTCILRSRFSEFPIHRASLTTAWNSCWLSSDQVAR